VAGLAPSLLLDGGALAAGLAARGSLAGLAAAAAHSVATPHARAHHVGAALSALLALETPTPASGLPAPSPASAAANLARGYGTATPPPAPAPLVVPQVDVAAHGANGFEASFSSDDVTADAAAATLHARTSLTPTSPLPPTAVKAGSGSAKRTVKDDKKSKRKTAGVETAGAAAAPAPLPVVTEAPVARRVSGAGVATTPTDARADASERTVGIVTMETVGGHGPSRPAAPHAPHASALYHAAALLLAMPQVRPRAQPHPTRSRRLTPERNWATHGQPSHALLRALCWVPVRLFRVDAVRDAIFLWQWLIGTRRRAEASWGRTNRRAGRACILWGPQRAGPSSIC
jgi:hypothetical protein